MTGGDFVVGDGIIISAGLAIWSLLWSSKLQRTQDDLTVEQNQLATDQNRLAEDQNRLAEEQNALLAEQNDLARRQAESHLQPASQSPLHYPSQPAASE